MGLSILFDHTTAMKPIHTAQFKATPQDFIVNELLADDFVFSNDGEHLWLLIQKQGVNTTHLVKLLAHWAGVPVHDVGYSGLKDRHACTQQWCSIRLPNMDLQALNLAGFDTYFAQILPPKRVYSSYPKRAPSPKIGAWHTQSQSLYYHFTPSGRRQNSS